MRALRSSSTGMNETSTAPASSASVARPEFGNNVNSTGRLSVLPSAFRDIGGDALAFAVGILGDEEHRFRRREHERNAQLAGGCEFFHERLVRGGGCA